jgi:hypothetical protein
MEEHLGMLNVVNQGGDENCIVSGMGNSMDRVG